ncbi:MAG: hypothetical protein O7C75_11900 [Verrucomicrobia bacterium]|nr:hypothetical protein [Verrucomicrobiota bacterium]
MQLRDKANAADLKATLNILAPEEERTAKFFSENGKTFWLAWSGWPEYDTIRFIRGSFLFK